MPCLMNHSMADGSRKFGELPESVTWYQVRDHVSKLSGAKLTEFLCDDVTEAWIDFSFRGDAFTINNQFGEYWFFVSRAECPDAVLCEVLSHWEPLLAYPDT